MLITTYATNLQLPKYFLHEKLKINKKQNTL